MVSIMMKWYSQLFLIRPSYCLFVPVPKPSVQKAIKSLLWSFFQKPTLLDLPSSYNFSSDMHPVIVSCALNNQIKQTFLRINDPLRQCSVLVP
jgi:hypothetical protein